MFKIKIMKIIEISPKDDLNKIIKEQEDKNLNWFKVEFIRHKIKDINNNIHSILDKIKLYFK